MKRRMLVTVGLIAGALLVSIAWGVYFLWWGPRVYFEERQVRFLREEMPAFEAMAQKVTAQKSILTDQPRDVHDLVPRPLGASAKTNADGSVTIVFPGGEGGPRHGHIYHSGALLTAMPGDPEGYIYHLTNGWYEY